MKFAVAAILGFAMTAVAIPAKEIRQRQFIADVSGQCATGDLYCCGPNIDGVTDDALDLLVKEGLLIERLVSGAESYCAPSTISKGVDTIFDALFGQDGDRFYCKNTLACCTPLTCDRL